MNIVPFPKYEDNLDELQKVYAQAMVKMGQLIENTDPSNPFQQEMFESLMNQHAVIVKELNEGSSKIVEETLRQAYEDGQLNAMVSMGMAPSIVEAKGNSGFSLLNRNRIDAMVRDTFSDVLRANSIMSEGIKRKIRNIEAQVMRENVALQRGTVTSAKDLRQRFLDAGFSKNLVEESWVGITDAGGKRWDLTTYTKMLARTKLQQAQAEGVRTFAEEHNEHDLAIISSHGAKDSCRHFEGMIVSLSGKTKGYRTLAELKGSSLIFHPNCQHSVHAIGNLDALPTKLKEKAKKAEQSAENALKNRDEILREDNRNRYLKKKVEKENKVAKKKERMEKARETRKVKKEREEKVPFKMENTRLYEDTKRNLYIGNKLIDNPKYNREAVEALFGKDITEEGLLNCFNPDPSKYDVKVNRMKFRQGSGVAYSELSLSITEGGKNIAHVQRTIAKVNGAVHVKNDLLEFEKSVQGAGLATNIYFKSETLYREMAKGKPINISLLANLDVGVYAWTRHGFDFKDPDEIRSFQKKLNVQIERVLNKERREGKHGEMENQDWFKLRKNLVEQKIKSFGYNNVEEIVHSWQFGALDDGNKYEVSPEVPQGHFGKMFMLEQYSSWDGVKKINQSHDSELIGNLYFESKGVK